MAVPFMSQIASVPSESLHKRSVLPSPSKSAVPTTLQLKGTVATSAALAMALPFMSQMASVPSEFLHKMSALPSPSKSPVPTIVQLKGTPTVKAPLASVDPFMNQTASSPVAELRHSTSDLQSPLKSLVTCCACGFGLGLGQAAKP